MMITRPEYHEILWNTVMSSHFYICVTDFRNMPLKLLLEALGKLKYL